MSYRFWWPETRGIWPILSDFPPLSPRPWLQHSSSWSQNALEANTPLWHTRYMPSGSPSLEPLLRTFLRTRFPPKRHCKAPPNNPSFRKCQKPQPPLLLKKVSQYSPNSYSSALVPLRSDEREYCQFSSHLYRSTPPICIAIRLPFVLQYFWTNLGGCGHWDVPHCCPTIPLVCTP